MIRRMRIYLGLDTLKYLYRGGRLTRLEAGVGMLANIHPLLALKDGTLEVCAKCMGTKKTMRGSWRSSRASRRSRVPEAVHLFLRRFPLPRADARVRDAAGADVVELGPTLAAHAGPGVYGAVFIEAEKTRRKFNPDGVASARGICYAEEGTSDGHPVWAPIFVVETQRSILRKQRRRNAHEEDRL